MLAAAIPITGHAFWFATPENEWKQLIWQHLPNWLTIWDHQVLRDYYEGKSSFLSKQHIWGWALPILAWTTFSSVFFSTMTLISILLRKQWTDHERLTFPVIQMPGAMMNPKSSFFQSRLIWIGFAISGTIVLINGMHFFFPQIPYVPVKRQHIDRFFLEKPWNAAMPMKISFYPFIIGLGFMMPLDLCFSACFFYLLTRIELVVIGATGIRTSAGFPYFHQQMFGAMLVVFSFYLWNGRQHFKHVIIQTIHGPSQKDALEPLSYRTTVIGILICFAFMIFFCVWMGMSLWFAIVYLLLFYVIAVTITRIRVELGLPVHDFEGMDPRTNLPLIFGSRNLGTRNLASSMMFKWAETGDLNPHPMPHQLEGFKMVDQAHADRQRFMISMLVAVVLSCLITFLSTLTTYYKIGANSSYLTRWYGSDPFNTLHRYITLPQAPNLGAISAMGIGGVIGSLLMILRTKLIWWPFHALGYILSDSWAMYNLWSCILISWLLKWMILKRGSLKAFQSALPFFCGLILGDFIIGGSWLAIGVILDLRQIYIFYL